ncbi:MAG: hypothetical protein A4E55_00114 [Pelotomaculum sp. PtaU1.Bin035]|nr:MAG: hypothetical protein A4E55_00114 [Pelotomaculum sp. PtaU1.Bin035]
MEPIVRTAKEVERRLREKYKSGVALRLFRFWFMMALEDEETIKNRMGGLEFSKNKSMLFDSGISWIDTDIKIRENK